MFRLKFLALSFFVFFFLAPSVEAGIILKVMGVNPSKTEKQAIPIRAYLPKEIKPEDVISKDDMEIAYDNQQGSYYIYGEYELEPGEVLEKEIEMKDIWAIPAQEIESLKNEAFKTAKLLENTDFRERINFLKQSIESKLTEIESSQKVVSANPERHISDYRDNIKQLESVRADLMTARSLLAQAKALPPANIWKLILIITAFLGFIGASSYFIWQAQSKIITVPTFGQETPEAPVAGETGKEAAAHDQPKTDDIEKIIKEPE